MKEVILIARQLEKSGEAILARVLIHSPEVTLTSSVNDIVDISGSINKTIDETQTMVVVATLLYKGIPILESYWYGVRDPAWDDVHIDAPFVNIVEALFNHGIHHFITNPNVCGVDLSSCTLQELKDITYPKKSEYNTNRMEGCIEISVERGVQRLKYPLEQDAVMYSPNELIRLARDIALEEPPNKPPVSHFDKDTWTILRAKPYRKRVIIAGAWMAAAIDVMDYNIKYPRSVK